MAELIAIIVRLAQFAVGLVILTILFAPLVSWVWAYIWPWLFLFSIFACFELLGALATRLEGAKQLRDDW
jgi:hypothetical protein